MSNIIDVLAHMGSDASYQSETAINELLITTELDVELSEAIINQDVTSLTEQLNVQSHIFCGIFPADDEDDSEEQESEKDSTEEANSKYAIGF